MWQASLAFGASASGRYDWMTVSLNETDAEPPEADERDGRQVMHNSTGDEAEALLLAERGTAKRVKSRPK